MNNLKYIKLRGLIQKTLILVFLILPFLTMAQRTFVHPGLSHKQSDLDRIRYMVEAGVEPWISSYNNLMSDPKASSTYQVRGNKSMTVITQDGTNYAAFSSDVKAAYLNALMWAVTRNQSHADKAVEIFNAWQNLTCFTGGGTESLNAGRVIWNLLEAAEIIKNTHNGWAASDIQKFKDMLVYPGLSHVGKPASVNDNNGTFYWRMYMGDAGRHGNQDLFGWRGILSMGIFLDDEMMYDRALRYLKGLPHRADDISYQSGPPNVSATPNDVNDYFEAYSFYAWNNDIPDYGYNGVFSHYIWENGQLQESSRDQDHAILGVGMCASLAEMAWNQGDDLYSFLENRILKAYEFALHYNVSYKYTYPDQPSPWEPTVENGEFIQRRDRTGRWYSKKINPYSESNFETVSRGKFRSDMRPIYELAYAHYGIRAGVSADAMKWLVRARGISLIEVGQERNGWSLDHLGWGGLTCYRLDGMAGDPCTFQNGIPVFGVHVLPEKIEAEDFDFFIGNGEGRTYHDNSSLNTGGAYRIEGAVDIEPCPTGGYNLTGIENGEWLTYTIDVPASSTYDLKINYAAANGNGKMKFVIGGEDKTGEMSVPFGGNHSTGLTDWKEIVLASGIQLHAGVQTMRVHFSGESNAFKLNSILLDFKPVGEKKVILEAKDLNGKINLNWMLVNILSKKQDIYRDTDETFEGSILLNESTSGTNFTDLTAESGKKYYYWLKVTDTENAVYTSNRIMWTALPGKIDDEFDQGPDGWVAATSGATAEVINGQLKMTLATLTNGKKRGDMSRSQGAILHAGFFPIVAVKIQAPEVVNILFDTEIGSFGNGSNKWNGKLGEVYYFDLKATGFGASNSMLSTNAVTTFTRFQFKLADITSGEDSYTCDWVKTFESVETLKTFIGWNATSAIDIHAVWNVKCYFSDDAIHIEKIKPNTILTIFDLSGTKLAHLKTNEPQSIIPWHRRGVFLVHVRNEGLNKTIKVVCQ